VKSPLILIALFAASLLVLSCQKEVQLILSQDSQHSSLDSLDSLGSVDSVDSVDPAIPALTRIQQAEQYVYYIFDGDTVVLTVPGDILIYGKSGYNVTDILIMDTFPVNQHQYSLSVRILDTIPWSYTASYASTGMTVHYKGRYYYPDGDLSFDLIEYGQPNEDILLRFSGRMLWDVDHSDTHTISGELRVKRQY
jgi:hypothetical protein